MDAPDLARFPGGDFVIKGLRDLTSGTESNEALLVLIGAPRLRSLGIQLPVVPHDMPPEHRLYDRLSLEDARTAHRRYNALLARLVSFERALACASA